MSEFLNEFIYIAPESILLLSSLFQKNEWQITEVHSELCQTSKMECFYKNIKELLAVDYLCKTLHLRCLTGF